MRHHKLDVLCLQETWCTIADIDILTENDEFIILEHGLHKKNCRRGSLGRAVILIRRCRAAFERANYDKQL
jgi:hypothetical protein